MRQELYLKLGRRYLPLRGPPQKLHVRPYGERSHGARLVGDQLGRADAGSWHIAVRYTVASSAAHRRAVGDFRVHFVVELYSWSPNRAVLETDANMVSRTKERALDPLLVPALPALATPSIC